MHSYNNGDVECHNLSSLFGASPSILFAYANNVVNK